MKREAQLNRLTKKHIKRIEKDYGITHDQMGYMILSASSGGFDAIPDWLLPQLGDLIEYGFGRKPTL